jgi:hypothetical protein
VSFGQCKFISSVPQKQVSAALQLTDHLLCDLRTSPTTHRMETAAGSFANPQNPFMTVDLITWKNKQALFNMR